MKTLSPFSPGWRCALSIFLDLPTVLKELDPSLARNGDRGYFEGLSACSLRLAAQDVALSRRKQGFESPRERQ